MALDDGKMSGIRVPTKWIESYNGAFSNHQELKSQPLSMTLLDSDEHSFKYLWRIWLCDHCIETVQTMKVSVSCTGGIAVIKEPRVPWQRVIALLIKFNQANVVPRWILISLRQLQRSRKIILPRKWFKKILPNYKIKRIQLELTADPHSRII